MELDKLMADEELFWAQRAKQRWLDLGNRSSRYFHKMATIRNRHNRIICLKDERGVFVSDSHDIMNLFVRHFRNIFGDGREGPSIIANCVDGLANGNLLAPFDLINTLDVQLSDHDRADLDRPFQEKEVEMAVFQMHGFKAQARMGLSWHFTNRIGMWLVRRFLRWFYRFCTLGSY